MRRGGFTLVELLVVIAIIGMVSAALIPAVVTAIGDRRLDASAQLLHGAIIGARDKAVHGNAPVDGRNLNVNENGPRGSSPAGIRLVRRESDPGVFDRIVPLAPGANYFNGRVESLPGPTSPGPLVLVANTTDAGGLPVEPTAWGWNVRLGDRLKVGIHIYTVCGPMRRRNADGYVNYNEDETTDYLLLVNGKDDDKNGYVDDGWDGFDNDGDGLRDNDEEWETEKWYLPIPAGSVYTLFRRPVPAPGSAVTLSVPISEARSSLPVNPVTGFVELMVNPDGSVDTSGPFAAPTATGMSQAKTVFVLDDGDKETRTITLWTKTGRVESDR